MFLRALLGKTEDRAGDFVLPGPTLFGQHLTGPISVTETSLLSIPAAYRCVQIIADSIASLPVHAVRNGRELADTPSILFDPSPGESRVDTVAALVTSLVMTGNAYALVAERDRNGFAQSIVVLSPDAVNVRQDAGLVTYTIGGNEYDSEDVVHVRGMTLPGHIRGLGPLDVQRRSLGIAIAGEDYASEMFVSGSIPSGVIKVEAELTREEAETIKNRFVAAHGGRQRSPALISGGMSYEALGFSAADLELLSSRMFNAQAVATIFGVPGFLIGIGSGDSKTYSNVQQDSQAFVRWTLRPHMAKIEAALSSLLPRGQEARFNIDALLRTDTLSRYQAHEIALRSGFMTPNEVRELEHLDPLEEVAPVVEEVIEDE
jgi:HK97 family phage portal protein